MSRGDYPKTDLRFPVMGTDFVFHDVFGYTECYWDGDFFFFHMPDDSAVVYEIGDTGFNGYIFPEYNSWQDVKQNWLISQEKRWGEKRYKDNFCPPITEHLNLAGWRIACDDGYEYSAFSDDGNVVRVNFREGTVFQWKLPGNGVIRYYFPGLLGIYVTEDGFLISLKKDLSELGKINVELTRNCRGKYYIMEDGTVYSESCLHNYVFGGHGLLSEGKKVQNAFYCENYRAFHYLDGNVEIFTTQVKKFGPLEVSNIKKVLFTESHMIFLHNDGHLSFRGHSTYRSCTGLNKYTNVRDLWGTDRVTFLLLENGEEVCLGTR